MSRKELNRELKFGGRIAKRSAGSGWGGRREGAGRKCGANPRVPHLRRETFARRHPCHVTLKVRPGLPSLRDVRLVRELEGSFARACDRGSFRLVHYSIQHDHVHMVVEAVGPEALGRGMKSLSARLARAVNRVFERSGAVLADRYHARALRTPREVRTVLAYVLLNHRKHARRPGRRARPDPASSGRWFDGWRERLAEAVDPAVASPHTWLLQKGWRRHGLLSLQAVPGGPSG